MAGIGEDVPLRAGGRNLLSQYWIEEVVQTRDADLRAHQVALTYSKFSVHLDNLIHGPDSVQNRAMERVRVEMCNTNWFNFATWGTLTVTRNIANQRAPQRVDDLFSVSLRRRLTPAVIRERAANGQRVSRALAWAQRLIFLTSAFAMAQFSSQFHLDDKSRPFVLDDDLWERIKVLSSVRTRPREKPRSVIGAKRHRAGLDKAFDSYRLAALQQDKGVRARLVLYGNVLLTSIEQDLANNAVRTVIDHVPQRVIGRVDGRIAKAAEMWTAVPRQIVELSLPAQTEGLRNLVDTAWSRLMTDQVLVMALPTETLRLGRDIPPRDAAQPLYPWPVRHLEKWPKDPSASPRQKAQEQVEREERRLPADHAITQPGDGSLPKPLQDVDDLVRSFDRTGPNGIGSAAQDWRRFDDRMNWAVTLMRSRQNDETLFWPPYSIEDEKRIVSQQLPLRTGDPSDLEVQAPLDPFADGEEI
jgi:hypothetical protein